ncbi:hypothetical protein [Desertibacillus haloalkaliphilus]|uniref:hypothetical protein n=1 Tax=Desertibacillus haloalkaliphilus TaxID=1328930 RepID=UPI001C2613EA|nr:hypothetical protein [Desertibacillus haloalkaliphilus]MBU8905558.1 hypothetical protein [Desertibacillus haloalkaliphilus]
MSKVEELDEKMMEFFQYYSNYNKVLSDFLGWDISFLYGEENDLVKISYPTSNFFIEDDTFEKASDKKMYIDTMINTLYELKQKYPVFDPSLKYILIDKWVNNIFLNECEGLTNEIEKFLMAFKEDCINLCYKTYENTDIKLGIIGFFQETVYSVKETLEKNNLDFIEFDTPNTLSEVIKSKPTFKLIDGKSLSLVINDFEVIGLARKKKDSNSIRDIILENNIELQNIKNELYCKLIVKNMIEQAIDEDSSISKVGIDYDKIVDDINNLLEKSNKKKPNYFYVDVFNKGFDVYFSTGVILAYNKGFWRVKNYNLLFEILIENLLVEDLKRTIGMMVYEHKNGESVYKVIVESINRFINYIKNLSQQNSGALFVILENNKEIIESENGKINMSLYENQLEFDQVYDIIPNELIDKELLGKGTYNDIQKDSNLYKDILNIDKYLFYLISSLDGAVLLDSSFNILSFGENIKTSELLASGTSDLQQASINGTRTYAAVAASKFGIAVKISEDGDIEVYREMDAEPLLRI